MTTQDKKTQDKTTQVCFCVLAVMTQIPGVEMKIHHSRFGLGLGLGLGLGVGLGWAVTLSPDDE